MNRLVPFRSVLIFGGAGFVGSNLAYRILKTTNAKVHIFDNLSRRGVHHNLKWLQGVAGNSDRLKVTIADIRDASLVQRAGQVATEIYHFAAQVAVTTSIADPVFDFDVNVRGTLNVLEAARKSGHRPFLLFTSTNKVYGNMESRPLIAAARRYRSTSDVGINESQPLDLHSPYGCSKGAADQYVRDYARTFDLPTVVFRMSCIAGPRQFGTEDQGWIAHFLFSALEDRPVTIYGDGRQVRDVLYVEDLVRAFEAVRSRMENTSGEIYNIGGGFDNSTSILEIIELIEKVTGKKLHYEMERARAGDQLFYVTDFEKLRRDTGWHPRANVRQTLENMYDWWKRNRELFPAIVSARPVVAARLQQLPEIAS
jgi:CDP-paratose 2-epimerase